MIHADGAHRNAEISDTFHSTRITAVCQAEIPFIQPWTPVAVLNKQLAPMNNCRDGSPNSRSGVSRAGVLFGLVIVLLFAALAPIWVLNQRSEQRSLTCQFNQTRIAEAFHRYDEDVGFFPGYRDYRFGRPFDEAGPAEAGTAEAGTGAERDATSAKTPELIAWPFPILPYLFAGTNPTKSKPAWHTLYESHGPLAEGENRATRPAALVSLFVCPDDPHRGGVAPLTMIANAGQPDRKEEPADLRKYGILMDGSGPTPSWSMKELLQADGISYTILLSENIDAGDWNAFTEPSVSILWRPLSMPDPKGGAVVSPLFINERTGESGAGGSPILFARPSAYHRWGVNVAFADGSNRVLTPAIDRRIYLQMLAPDDEQ